MVEKMATKTSSARHSSRGPTVVIHPSEGLNIGTPAIARRVGLSLPHEMAVETWQSIGEQIIKIGDSTAWWIADWINYGQQKFPDRYRKAAAKTNLSYQTLRNYAWVARRFPISRRRAELSFQHHALVAGLEEQEQDRWLERALERGLSATELRKQLKSSRSSISKSTSILHMSFELDKVQQWRAAAEAEDQEVTAWIIHLLDAAASRTLAMGNAKPLAIDDAHE